MILCGNLWGGCLWFSYLVRFVVDFSLVFEFYSDFGVVGLVGFRRLGLMTSGFLWFYAITYLGFRL